MRASEDRSGPLVTCTGNPCQSTGTSSPVSTGDQHVLPVQVTNGPDWSSEVLNSRPFLFIGKIDAHEPSEMDKFMLSHTADSLSATLPTII